MTAAAITEKDLVPGKEYTLTLPAETIGLSHVPKIKFFLGKYEGVVEYPETSGYMTRTPTGRILRGHSFPFRVIHGRIDPVVYEIGHIDDLIVKKGRIIEEGNTTATAGGARKKHRKTRTNYRRSSRKVKGRK